MTIPFWCLLWRAAVAVSLVTACPAGSANATSLISAYDAHFGADAVTLDTATNLEWLDLTRSVNRSYDDLVGMDGSNEFALGGDFAGWRYATQPEVITLLEHHRFPNVGGSTPANTPFYSTFVALLGETGPLAGSPAATYTIAFTSTVPPGEPLVVFSPAIGTDVAGLTDVSIYQRQLTSYSGTAFGSWLVRATTVPEPGAGILLATGLVGALILFRGRRLVPSGLRPRRRRS